MLGGCAAVEAAARAAGHDVTVPFTPGRTDASEEQTDAASFAPLEPTADGFRNYLGKGHDRASGDVKWTGTRYDLVFGSNSQLRAIAEVYGADDAQQKFAADFVAAWNKVMNAERFDLD